tara:strand:- start:978 stop:1268 length:291 start_codon:yes stop_codon:yes gene_type:complete
VWVAIILIARSNHDTPLMVASILASVISSLWHCNLGNPSTQASLIDVLDVPLTPVWTLLILGLVPTGHETLDGGITIVAILIGIYVMDKTADVPAN